MDELDIKGKIMLALGGILALIAMSGIAIGVISFIIRFLCSPLPVDGKIFGVGVISLLILLWIIAVGSN